MSVAHGERIWLKSYPAGVPADIDVQRYASLNALLEESFARHAERPAFHNLGCTLGYGALDRMSRSLAAFLQDGLGLKRGERVVVMLPNLLQYPVAAFSVLRAGLVLVNTNPLYTPRELHHQLADSGAAAIILLENQAHTLAEAMAGTGLRHVIVSRIGDLLSWPRRVMTNLVVKHVRRMVRPYRLPGAIGFLEALQAGAGKALVRHPLGHDDPAVLQYTGGTTGVAKAAVLTHGNLVANTLQSLAWHAPVVDENGGGVVVTAIPLYHIFAFTINCLTYVALGGLNRLITDPRDLPAFVEELRRSHFTCISGVNTLFNHLLHTPGFETLDFSSLKITIGGGMAVQRVVAERWREVTGRTLIEGFGLTETSPLACANPLNAEEFSGTIGLPIPSTEACVRDDDGAPLGIGIPGELWLRGPQVMQGYWQRPDETAKVLSPDGWLRTGDIAVMDERGYFKIVDRKKDLILVSGFNVFPNEIEEVIAAHPGVLEVAAIGVPDSDTGEAVKVFVVRKDPALDEAGLRTYCKQNLVGYKRPHHIVFREQLPKSNVGKILRRILRDEVRAP
ncbi:MAG: AMP-binding protein [Gammaproteobacteria bacterium]